jgi:hypothetical protein
MSNQASEDELREKINSALFADDFPILNDIEKDAVDRILAIIRTEKLKLLAEVRERVVGTKDLKLSDIYGNDWRNNYGYTEGQVRDAANHLQRKQLESLTELEAEL